MDNIKEKIIAYNEALNRKEELAEMTKANNEEVERLRDELANAMIDEEIPSLVYEGYKWTVGEKTKYSKAAGADEQLFDALETDGLGDIIKRTVNAQTLQATMSQIVEDNEGLIPEQYEGIINVYKFNDIYRRKQK